MHNICPECGDKIVGRTDKKFCSDQCRNSFNNRKNKDTTKLLRDVNSILLKNHRILKDLYDSGINKIHRDKLLIKGFNFDFFTSMCTNKSNVTFHYCYDLGFYKHDDKHYAILKNEELPGNLIY